MYIKFKQVNHNIETMEILNIPKVKKSNKKINNSKKIFKNIFIEIMLILF